MKKAQDLQRQFGYRSRTTVYQCVKDGLLPPPLKDGCRSFWTDTEIQQISLALSSGCSNDEIRQLVSQLVVLREQKRVAIQNQLKQGVPYEYEEAK